ncbi:MAG: hypothetical protein ACXV2G_08000, partial [Actinomycetes bacterium]
RSVTAPFGVTPCDDTTRLRRGTYAGLQVTGRCRLPRGVFTVNGPLSIAPGGTLVGPSSTLLVSGSGTLDNQGSMVLGGSAGGFSLYWTSTQPLVLGGTSATLGADVYVRSSPVSISTQTLAVEGTMVTGSLDVGPLTHVSVTAGGAPVTSHGDLGLVQ